MSHAMTERFKTIEGTPTQRFVGYMLADAYNDVVTQLHRP
jgi:hypothetical protein